MITRRKNIISVIKRWLILLLCLSIVFFLIFLKVKPLIFTYAKSSAETILLNAANEAILDILADENIIYSDISIISRNEQGSITGIEIATEKVNYIKSKLSSKISQKINDDEIHTLRIPFGTLLGSEYTTGYGPRVNFKMQFTQTSKIDFESKFEQSGINNVLHQIIIKMDLYANILMIGCTEGFSVSTTAIAAQTVISGEVPDSFTNVIEYPGDDLADEIFNFSDNH